MKKVFWKIMNLFFWANNVEELLDVYISCFLLFLCKNNVQLQSWNFYYLEFMYFSQDEWISDTMKLLKNITQRKNVIKACGFFLW